jgi:cation diffusion facilitator CzcD-associated flavoprotein CzcO
MTSERVDVLIIGAGLSGIGAAAHLTRRHPGKSYLILEARDTIGGTWDLFRYPGIRSDTDLHTFCYAFKPWLEDRAIADAPAILRYIREAATEHGIDEHIRFGHRVNTAEWSSTDGYWTVEAERLTDSEPVQIAATWIFCAGGYYRYDSAYVPELPGIERFDGPTVHPQFWPEDLDYTNKRVVVIGSGATAMTIVPALTERARHVTLLQRTPTYVIAIPAIDPIARRLKRLIGPVRAHRIARRKNVRIQLLIYSASRRHPRLVRRLIRALNARALPAGYDVDTHFNPPYEPWDQRMCVVPDGDLFHAIRNGRASIVTDRIETFTDNGIRLRSGSELEADVIVTATGLNLHALGGVCYRVDGDPVALTDRITYKGMMLTDMPNFICVVGYINASWTLKLDLICEHFCRLLTLMDERDYAYCVPESPDPAAPTRPLMEFGAGYVLRSMHQFPKQGATAPWELSMDYLHDRRMLVDGPVGDHMRFVHKSVCCSRLRQPQARAAAADSVSRDPRSEALGAAAARTVR